MCMHQNDNEQQNTRAPFLWFFDRRFKNGNLTDDTLRAKARRFGIELDINDFSYSNGWLQRLKQRYGLVNHVLSGESAGVDRSTKNQ